MGKITEILAGIKVIDEVSSTQNGNITVIKSLAFGKYIQVGGLTQSGGIIKSIWTQTLKKVHKDKPNIKNSLVLGLGGGSITEVLGKFWPGIKITGVDIDPIMIDLGKKHLGLSQKVSKIIVSDAYEFVKNAAKSHKKYDLICVDLYVGDEFPLKFESDLFLSKVKKILNKNGVAVFNRLYYGAKRSKSVKFGVFLENYFRKVKVVYPEANVMFVCSSEA